MGEGYRPLYRLLAMVQSEDEAVAFVHLKTIKILKAATYLRAMLL